MQRNEHHFEFVIDISGHFPDSIRIGMCSYLTGNKQRILRELNQTQSRIYAKRFKASVLDENELLGVLRILDRAGVHMTLLELDSDYLRKLRLTYHNEHKHKEKIIAAAYFTTIQAKARAGWEHGVIIDEDNWMDVPYALATLKRVSKAEGYVLTISSSRTVYNDFIRFSDYVAAAKRKIRGERLSELKNFRILPKSIPK